MVSNLFVNIPVNDLKKTMEFFRALGFEFNMNFTNDDAACLVINKDISVMLLTQSFFKGFIKKDVADVKKTSAAILSLQVGSKKEVDEFVAKAVAAGATKYADVKDYGFMYQHGFEDLNGQLWEVFHMDPNAAPPQQ